MFAEITNSIKKKLIIAFSAVAVIGLLASLAGFKGVYQANGDIVHSGALSEMEIQSEKAETGCLNLRRFEKDYFLNIGDAEKQKSYLDKFNKTAASTHEALQAIMDYPQADLLLSKEDVAAVGQALKDLDTYTTGARDVFNHVSSDPTLTARDGNIRMEPFKEATHRVEGNVQKVADDATEILHRNTLSAVSDSAGIMKIVFIAMIVAFFIAIILGIMLSARISTPIERITLLIKELAQGDLTKRTDINSKDEIGEMAQTLNRFVESLQGSVKGISGNADTVAAAATELSAVSTQIAGNAEEMTAQTGTVASSTEQATTNINTIAASAEAMSNSANSVATAIEEMSASLNEVAKNCQKELQIAANAGTHVGTGKEIMGRLETAAKSIGKVISVINDISDQTNLLALNATIEAASAGEAGKGFAVVANEVKELAKQTAEATQQIESQIEEMQKNTASAVEAIDLIAKVVEEVNVISQNIVSSVEEQSATVNEIAKSVSHVSSGSMEVSRNVTESAKGLSEVSRNISGVNSAVADTASGILQVKNSAAELSKLSEGLKTLVGKFKI